MSKPYTKERAKEFKDFLLYAKKKKQGFLKNSLEWFKLNVGEIVTSRELAQIPGKAGFSISHNIRRVFELRDEQGYEIINHKDNNPLGEKLKVDEWILLKSEPNPKMIRNRGVNKRIMFEVFERDNYTCQTCGRTPQDDDPFKAGHKIKLHVGHITAHKQNDGGVSNVGKELTKDDFMTMCNVCNEGAKNKDIRNITLLDRVKKASEKIQKEIYDFLKERFS